MRFMISVLGIIFATGCNPTSFGGSDNTKKAPAEVEDPRPPVEEKKEDVEEKKEDPPKCIKKEVGIDIMFALDITYSMRTSLGIISDNIVNLTQKLEEKYSSAADINYGVVAFHDDVLTRKSGTFMWKDKNKFRSQIDKMKVSSYHGGDAPEAGLLAIRTAYDALVNEGEGDLKYIVYVSDQYGHNGDNTPRDCSLQETVDHWGVNDDIRILASVPNLGVPGTIIAGMGRNECMPEVTTGSIPEVKDQYVNLFEKIQAKAKKEEKDFHFQFLDFPLNSDVLLEIPKAITCE